MCIVLNFSMGVIDDFVNNLVVVDGVTIPKGIIKCIKYQINILVMVDYCRVAVAVQTYVRIADYDFKLMSHSTCLNVIYMCV